MGFIWNNTSVDIPRLTDILHNGTTTSDIARTLTYAWIWTFGGWFFAIVIGGLAAALYIKYQNAMVPVVFLILMVIFYGGVLSSPVVGFPAADIFVYIVAVLAAFAIGFMLYKLFVGNKNQ